MSEKRRPRWLLAGCGLFAFVVFHLVMIPVIHTYEYVSSDGGFEDSEVPEKGRTLEMVEANFADYEGEEDDGLVLCRTTNRDWWAYWEWYDYMTHRRWDYPYREPTD